MKILVTGGAGFIGTHLVNKLREKNEVTVIDRKTGVDILTSDLSSYFDVDYVFHLAANSDISIGNSHLELHDTFLTTKRVLEWCIARNVKGIVFASSSAVYGSSYLKVSESFGPCLPLSYYGAAKLASEAFIASYCRLSGMKSWILRFPNVVGSYATHGVIYDLLRKDKNPLKVLGRGNQLKPYMHVSELIDAILYVWKNTDALCNVYNIGPIGRTYVREIAEMISDNIEYSGNTWEGDCEQYEFDISKLTTMGWSPRMTSTEAVKLAIEECKKEL